MFEPWMSSRTIKANSARQPDWNECLRTATTRIFDLRGARGAVHPFDPKHRIRSDVIAERWQVVAPNPTILALGGACRKSNPDIFVIQSADDCTAKNTPCSLNGPRWGRILIQEQVRARLITVIHIRLQHMTKMLLAEHNNVLKALPSDRTDQSFSISVLPWRAQRRRSIANAH